MSQTVGDFLINRLSAWGITRIFGFPGDGINGLMGALNRADGKIDFIQVLHEENAAFMACAHAKFTGEVGVSMAFLKAGDLCEAYQLPFSSRYAPAQHLHAALSSSSFYIAEYFHDHVRIEQMLFNGVQKL